MPPFKAGKLTEASPTRSSVRLRVKKQEDSADAEKAWDASLMKSESHSRRRKQDNSAYVEELRGTPQEESITRPRRKKREDPTYVEEQNATASGASLEEEDTAETRVVTRSFSRNNGSPGAETEEREMFDPAWRQFELPNTPEPPFSAFFRTHDGWRNEASAALALAVERGYSAMRSIRRRFDPLADIEDITIYIIRVLGFPSSPFDDCSRGMEDHWRQPRSCSGIKLQGSLTKYSFHRSNNGDESQLSSEAQAVNTEFAAPDLLEPLSLHRRNCTCSLRVNFPRIENELPNLVADTIDTTSKNVCHALQNLGANLVVYYTEVQTEMTIIHNHVHSLRDFAREGAIRLSAEEWTVKTRIFQELRYKAITSWQEACRALIDAGGGMQDVIDPLRHSLESLIEGLQDALAITIHARNETIMQLPWHRKLTLWTQASGHEPEETRTMTQAILVLEEWISEASALENILSEVYIDMTEIHRSVGDVYGERLGFSMQTLWTDAELPEMLPFLGWMSEDVGRICSAVEDSRVVGRLLQGFGMKVYD